MSETQCSIMMDIMMIYQIEIQGKIITLKVIILISELLI